MSDIQLAYMYIIAGRTQRDALTDEVVRAGGAMIDFVYGHGYYEKSGIFDMLGFGEDESKIIISFLILSEKSAALIETLNEKYEFKKRNSGIAFTIPIDKLVY